MEGYKEFVDKTINSFDEESFLMIKRSLVGEYLDFSFVKEGDITKEVLSEKVCDYFGKVELKTWKSFNEQLQVYIDNLKSLVKDYIAEEPKPKKKDTTPAETPRARKYYVKAIAIRDPKNMSLRKLIDYTRIMLCLYTAIVSNNHKTIEDFDYSADCLDQNIIINAMKNEKSKRKVKGKNRFNTEDLYSLDTCTFVITVIMLQTIADERW